MCIRDRYLARFLFIVRVQHLGNRLRRDLCIDRLIVVTGVERCEVELLRRLGRPQPEPIGRVHAIAKDGHVPGGTAHEFSGDPLDAQATTAGSLVLMFGMATELDVKGNVRTMDQPRTARTQPFVGQFDLPAIPDRLRENAELVANCLLYTSIPQDYPRVIIEAVEPQVDGGRFPIKRVVGEKVAVSADIYKEGHDKRAALLKACSYTHRDVDKRQGSTCPK